MGCFSHEDGWSFEDLNDLDDKEYQNDDEKKDGADSTKNVGVLVVMVEPEELRVLEGIKVE